MRRMKKQTYKRLLMIVIVGCTLFMLMNTFAFWTQKLSINNEYQLGKYSTEIEEEFESPINWLPGETIDKDVMVVNTGTVPVFVKAQINLKWLGQDEITKENYALTFVVEETKNREYAALITWGKEVVRLARGKSRDTSIGLGLPTIDSIAKAQGKWLLLDEEPDASGNLTFYYVGILGKSKRTPLLLNSVQMNPKIEAKIIETHTIYNQENKSWQTKHKENPSYSYEDARFLLTVNAQTVQAHSDAMGEVFVSNNTAEQAIVGYLRTVAERETEVINGTVKNKELYFDEIGGEIKFTPVGSDGQNWFMSFQGMTPGSQYIDSITIENRSKKNYDLYMQVLPITGQNEKLNELLEMISMKVYLKDVLIYEGSATGKEYPNSKNNLQKVVSLGGYQVGIKNTIRVELELSKDISMEYCDLLAKVDWKFTATEEIQKQTEVKQSQKQEIVDQPKTGDEAEVISYVVSMLLATVMLLSCGYLLKRQRRRGGEK